MTQYGMQITPTAKGGWSVTLKFQLRNSRYQNVQRSDGKGSLTEFIKGLNEVEQAYHRLLDRAAERRKV